MVPKISDVGLSGFVWIAEKAMLCVSVLLCCVGLVALIICRGIADRLDAEFVQHRVEAKAWVEDIKSILPRAALPPLPESLQPKAEDQPRKE